MSSEVEELQPGMKFGPYHLLEEIGEGAMARVFSARVMGASGFQKEIALKVVHQQLAESQPQMIRSMINEARIGGLLSHPNIVQTLSFQEFRGRHLLAMEYVEGPTFRTLVDQLAEQGRLLPPGIVADVGMQICRGLQHAIERDGLEGQPLNLVHRDLKPENLILAQGGLVKILDFGIARSTANLYLTTTMNLTRGTPCYMSPEQLRGEELDGRSDLFALGCVLYELLMGETLFQEAGFKLVQKVLEGDISDNLARAHERSPALAAIIAKLLERPLKKRYTSAVECEPHLAQVMRTEMAYPDLSTVARIYSQGELPSWDDAPAPQPSIEVSDKPPSGKAGGFWDWLKSMFGM